MTGLIVVGGVVAFWLAWWIGAILIALGAYELIREYLPVRVTRMGPWLASGAAVVLVAVLLTDHWRPLGAEKGLLRNLIFVGMLIGGLLLFFQLFQRFLHVPVLR